jgi:3-oxoacyl-[acyl-carrier protein] reductase
MSRIGRRAEVAAMVTFLLSESAGYVTGQSIHVNGGLTL